MKVLFDVVYYHCGPNAVFLKDQPDWVLRNADGTFKLGEWAFPRLDLDHPAVREYLYENMKWYLTEFGCDGFRSDVGSCPLTRHLPSSCGSLFTRLRISSSRMFCPHTLA